MSFTRRWSLLLALLAPAAAWAHPDGAHAATFFAGISHPMTGLDHVLAMIAVGLIAAKQGTVRWATPLAFLASLAIGALLGGAGFIAPFTELAILGSVILFGLAVLMRSNPWPLIAYALCGVFGIFHGLAHGAEANGTPAAAYIVGMLTMTAVLHAAGMGVAGLVAHRFGEEGMRWAGVPVTLGGIILILSAS